MSDEGDTISFTDLDPVIENYVDTWHAGGFEQDAEINGWGSGLWESWKWEFADHVREELADVDLRDCKPEDVEKILDTFDDSGALSTQIPVHMIGGGQNGGVAWQQFKAISREDPEATAALFSQYFDPDLELIDRLEQFQEFYAEIDVGDGTVLALGTCLLMFVYPDRYVHYKYTEFKNFFEEFSEYHVSRGFDANQYVTLNKACQRIQRRFAGRLAESSMLHVQTLIWVWTNFSEGSELEAVIDEEFPGTWSATDERRSQVLEMVRYYLEETDSSQSTADRRRAAQQHIAEDQGVHINTIQQKMGPYIWEDEVGKDVETYQREYLDPTLERIERRWSGVDPETLLADIKAGTRAVYWVNQSDSTEYEQEYLQSQDQYWTRDLSDLEEGDVLFHYIDQAIRAYSVVTREMYTNEIDGEEEFRADVEMEWFDEPKPITEINGPLRQESVHQGIDHYPINESGGVQSWYLCDLTPEAAEILLSDGGNGPRPTNYFWVSSRPEIWSVESIRDGDEKFYAAVAEDGTNRQYPDAFESATRGDKVLFYEATPKSSIVGVGTVTQGYHEESKPDYGGDVPGITFRFDRPLDGPSWDVLDDVASLEESFPIRNNAQGSLLPLEEDEFNTILELAGNDGWKRLATMCEPIDIEVSLPDTLYFESTDRLTREIQGALNSGKHIIFTGPPGTGKTKLAKHISSEATALPQVDDYRFTTATAEWTAFDTIGGYMPARSADGDELVFEPRLFLKCFRRDEVVNEWLVIDEINRADIDKAFGQLFSVLSGDSTELPYERERTVELLAVSADTDRERLEAISSNPDAFPVTPSWRLLATMNTYDKASLYELSYAFMRRFNFIHIGVPELQTADGAVRTSLLDPDGSDNYATAWIEQDGAIADPLRATFRRLAVLWERINRERTIGPAIVHDMLNYVAADEASGEALTSAVVSLVYPQLEGMRPEAQKRLIRSLTDSRVQTEHDVVDLDLDRERLERKAEDFLGVSFDDGA